jgi:hypothetical protein
MAQQLLRSAEGQPCLPYLGAWLTDLTFLGESRTWIEREEENLPPLLNVSKLSKIASILSAIRGFQDLPFPFEHQRDISYYLMSEISAAPVRKDEELYQISLGLEVSKKRKLFFVLTVFVAASRSEFSAKDGSSKPVAESKPILALNIKMKIVSQFHVSVIFKRKVFHQKKTKTATRFTKNLLIYSS